MLHLVSEVGFTNTTDHRSLSMATKILGVYYQKWTLEELCIWNQSVSGSKAELLQCFNEYLEKERLDPATYTFEIKVNQSTMDPLVPILEKLTVTEHHLTNLTAKVNYQEEHLASIIAITNQQKEHLATISTQADQQQEHLAAISAKADHQHAKFSVKIDQQTDLIALGVKMQPQIAELWKEIP